MFNTVINYLKDAVREGVEDGEKRAAMGIVRMNRDAEWVKEMIRRKR